jgi:lysine-N-methylase
MKIYAPEYYLQFKCIANNCKHSCCIGWEIDVDDDALDKYRMSNNPYCENIINSIEFEDTPHFRLTEKEQCPHLENGLCNIIRNAGEEYLCHICKEHPRFYNYTSLGKEVGIGMACEEACRIILSSDNYDKFVVLGSTNEEIEYTDFNSTKERDAVYSILKDKNTYSEKLNLLYSKYDISLVSLTTDKLNNIFSSLEYLDSFHKNLFTDCSFDLKISPSIECYLCRALAYFVYRHCSEAYDYIEFRASLGLTIFLERLLAFVLTKNNANSLEEIAEFARIVSEEIEYSTDNTDLIKQIFETK